MANTASNNIKLGAFVFSGFLLLVIALFYISNSSNIFGNDPELKTRFKNTGGLQEGSNVLFAGINAGTVRSVDLIDANTIEVTMLIDEDIMQHIPKNSLVSIGTEGLMGNKVVNIVPGTGSMEIVKDGDYLIAEKKATMDEMLQTLSRTNDNIAGISEALKITSMRIKDSELLSLLEDKDIPENLKRSVRNIYESTDSAREMMASLNSIVRDAKQGKGAAGMLLTDKKFADNLQQTVENINMASKNANAITNQLNDLAETLNADLATGKGPLNAILKDSTLTIKIKETLDNLEKGTDNFNQNMEALKHNFLFRGYFRKVEKARKEKERK
jgi:phospholipid/cholesterol/gamma-HCH transport system substrate-binding protein